MAQRFRWRVGVAGLARAGIWRRLRAWLASDQVELVAVADPDRGRRQRALDLGVPRAYREPREVLARESLDLVHVAANPAHQGALIRSALMRGLDVLVEPPVTSDGMELAKLMAASQTYGGLLVPLWPTFFDPPWREAGAEAPQVGEPVHLEAVQVAGLDPWWAELAHELADDPQLPVPGLISLGAQGLVSLALQLLGLPEAVAAWEAVPAPGSFWGASATMMLLYPWGTARLRLEWCQSGGSLRGPGFTLYGTEGRLEGRGLRLARERPEGRRLLHPSPPEAPWQPILQALTHPAALPADLAQANLRAVGRVVAALDRSAAAAGSLQRLDSPAAAAGRQPAARTSQ